MKSFAGSHRPKRAGGEFLRHNLNAQDEAHVSKKARFDARNPSTLAADEADEDPVLDLDEIGGKGAQSKRNAVELDGYESDSSNDNFDRRAENKARELGKQKTNGKKKEEDEDDIFAEDGEDESDVEGNMASEGKKKRAVRFLDEGDIEGQVATSKGGGHVSADFRLNSKSRDVDVEESSDESGDDEQRDMVGEDEDEIELGAGAKKKHAPKLDAFNMRNEAEEGKFDESGNFVRKATDPFAVHDSWLEGSSKADMRRAKEAREKREEERRRRDIADDAVSTRDVLGALISRLRDEETVLEALARLGTGEKKKAKWKKRKDNTAMDVDENVDTEEVKRKETVEAITAAADHLLTQGQTEIYEAERALLMRQYKRETGQDWAESMAEDEAGEDKQWEYRWADARDGGESHGPYDGPTMAAWEEAGYFGEGVEFREIGKSGWNASVQFGVT